MEQRNKRFLRRALRIFLVISISLGVAVIGGWPVYVAPQVDALRPADAILVLGGYGYKRYQYGLELGKQGWAPTVVWSVEKGGSKGEWMATVCKSPPFKFTVRCISADPQTTRGEGRELRRLATEYGWRTVIVVTYRPHISRARFILQRCFSGELIMVESPADIPYLEWAKQFVYQSAGYAKAVMGPDC
jgi:uncharacterized SAM-binding protein YcdF (DUF218 family)